MAGAAGPAYAASAIAATGGVVYVAAHNDAAAMAAVQAAAAMKSARGIEVEVQIVPRNADQLQVAIRQIANDPWWKHKGIRWASVGADLVTGLVQVSLVSYNPTIAHDIAAHYGTAVQVLAGDHQLPTLT
ncbi:MAG TPA: hypothetical protein VIJ96_07010 [Acidothermaceae bacterium]